MKTFQILANLIAVTFLAVCSISASAGTLSQLPLSLKSGVPPNIMFALSVEFPTAITPAYGKNSSNSTDSSYSRSNTYLGYFDNTKCYRYNGSVNSTAYSGSSTVVTGWFEPVSYAALALDLPNACLGGYWSGNFLNWVSMSAVDEFRYAMTGGNRVVDLGNSSIINGLTVLQRSYQTSQGPNFITKQWTEDGYTTKYAATTQLTINSKGNGVQMVVAQTGTTPSDTAVCVYPGGPHGCDGIAYPFQLVNSGDPVACTAWSGAGTSASPYKCTSFTDYTGSTLANPPTPGTVSVTPSGTSSLSTTGNYLYNGSLPSAAASNNYASEYWPGSYTSYNWAVDGNGSTFRGTPVKTTTSPQMVFFGAGTSWAVMNVPAGTPLYCSNTWVQSFNIVGLTAPTSSTPGDPDPGVAKACYQMNEPASSATGTVTANCTTMYSNNPQCTFTLSNTPTNSTSSSCSQWIGAGTLASPYTCVAFGSFSSPTEYFANTGLPTGTSSFAGSLSTPYTNSSVTCSVSYNSTTPTSSTTTCTGLDGNTTTATCSGASNYSGNGGSSLSTTYACSSFSVSSPSTDNITSSSIACNAYTQEGTGSSNFCTNYSFIGNVPSTGLIYYSTPYTGIYGSTGTYYYSNYAVTFGTSETFNVRVQVCNPTVGVESNCTLYGDGNTYKPTGVLQNNGNTMRFGVTSYFDKNDIDNAVLRAKAKYLAPQEYLSAGTFTPNAAAEWSATDGTFVNNPDSADSASWGVAGTNSGVINYINQFGTVSAGNGYKTYDDIGKLYYETLRYLRGGNYTNSTTSGTPSPTAAFYNGATSSNNDGFPVITTWDDPVKYSCQKNYIITMGDVHTWCDKRLPGGTYNSSNTSVCNAYTDSNNNSHPADQGSLTGDTGITGWINAINTGAANIGTPSSSGGGVTDAANAVGAMEGLGNIATTQTGAGGASFYMPALAAWAAANNIRPDMAASTSPMHVKSYVIDVQEAGDCAYQLHFWLSAKYGDPGYYTNGVWTGNSLWYNSIPGNSITCSYDDPPHYGTSSAMLWPKNLLRAGDPVSMINSVNSAIQAIAAEQGDEAALAQSAGTLDTGTGAYIYQAGYNSGGWIGDMKAYIINQNGLQVDAVSGSTTCAPTCTPAWAASSMLPNPSARNVFSFNRSTASGIKFALDSSNGLSYFDAYQQGYLNSTDNYGPDRVKYILGDMSNEAYLPSAIGAATPNTLTNHGWRSRKAVGVSSSNTPASFTAGPTGQLGDIIDSNPLYVSAPASVSISDASYKTFAEKYAARTPMVYVGGNDGMLHAFNASYTISATTGLPVVTGTSGTELFAYVPHAIFPNLANLMSSNYVHTFYVDGSPVSGDVCTNSGAACNGTGDVWTTILVGGLNAGGKGIYALDITDPVNTDTNGKTFDKSKVLWEFTGLDHPNLGNTFSKPIIAKLNNGRWAVIFGNGFNTGNTDVNDAFLFILYVDPNLSGTPGWVLNTNYFRITLPSPGSAIISPCTTTGPCNASNGLAGIAGIDADHNGTIDYVYGGDRNGNMWKVDLTSSSPASWTASFSGTPLFSAPETPNPTGGSGVGYLQQITTAPTIANSPNGGYMVLFGTGSWIDTTDTNPPNGSLFYTDTLYGIWDQHGSWDSTNPTSSPVTGWSVLQRQALLGTYSIDSTGATCTSGTVGCTTYTIQSSCQPNFTTTPMISPGNVGPLCPQYVPIPNSTGVFTTGSTDLLASPTGTTQQFGWFFNLPGNGERSHSDPPSLIGSDVQFTTLTPSTNPCTGNTQGQIYNFTYATGEAPSNGIYILPGTTANAIAGLYSWTPPGGTAITVVLSGQSLSGGAAMNPLTFNANPPASVTEAVGMPTTMPTVCTTAAQCETFNNTGGIQTYIPGWGFLQNQGYGPSSLASRGYVLSCVPAEIGGGITCTWQHKPGQFGRLSWKQIN